MKRGRFKLQYNAPVILTFALIALLVLGLAYLTGGASMDFFMVYRSRWTDPLQYLRLFTHILGHSGFEHFYGNFVTILLLGPIVEEKYGSKKLLSMILFTALVTGLVQVIFFPYTALMGASGIVYMLIILASVTDVRRGEIPITLIIVSVLYLSGQVIDGFTAVDNVSQMAHIIGGVCGGIFGLFFPGKVD